MSKTDDLKRAIETDGYTIVPEFCKPELLNRILNVASARANEVRGSLGNRDIGIGSAAGYDEIVQRSPGRWDVPISPKEYGVRHHILPWWSLVTSILGDDAEHSFSGVVSSDPGSPAQRWHTDSPHVSATHRSAHALNVLVALQDIPLDMGPTEVAIGSHRLTNHLANPALDAEQLIYQHTDTPPGLLVSGTDQTGPQCHSSAMSAGTCLIFDDRLLHRGLANRSDSVRHVAYFSYRQSGYSENTHFESTRSIYKD